MYTIIVAEDDTKNASGLEMPSWRDVQSYSVWLPYQAIEPYYPFKNSSVEDFTIGAENCDNRQIGYCNGPLKSGTTYRVKVRAFTAPDKFTDTAYSFPIQTGKCYSMSVSHKCFAKNVGKSLSFRCCPRIFLQSYRKRKRLASRFNCFLLPPSCLYFNFKAS